MISPPIIVRPAREEDLPELLALERELPTAPHWSSAEYRTILLAPAHPPSGQSLRRCLLVATEDDRQIGFAVARALGPPPETEAELETIAVRATGQRRGAGRLLLQAILNWCQAQGASVVSLEVRARSLAAQRLYARAGFFPAGRRSSYYAHPEDDAILMRRQAKAPPRSP